MVNEIFVRVFEICNKHCALFHDNRWVKRILDWNPGGGRPQQFFSNGKLAYKILASGISWVTGFMLPKTRMLQCHHPNVLRLQPLKQRAGNAGYAVGQELSFFLFPPLILENFVWIVLSSGASTGNDPNPPVIMSAECLLTRSKVGGHSCPASAWDCVRLPIAFVPSQGDVSAQNMLARARRASIWPWSGVVASCCNRTSCNRPLCHHFVLLLLGEM